MATKIRLARMGGHKRAFYRIVVADSEAPRDGRFVEVVGHYDPHKSTGGVVIKEERVREWLSKGAIPTMTVSRLLAKHGVKVK
ncbi:MAG: 30S ribosomal protein S16 [Syntrophales bacterium]|nr:30S ribosomal protein S16 [Syntrophales bacterium]